MPDLSTRAIHQFWKNYPDPSLYQVVAFMDSVEQWTLDSNPDVSQSLLRLGEALDGITHFTLEKENLYIKLGCHLKTSCILRILQAIDSTHPGSASRVLMRAEEAAKNNDAAANLFLRRNIAFERLRLLGRIFSTERFLMINKAMENEDEG